MRAFFATFFSPPLPSIATCAEPGVAAAGRFRGRLAQPAVERRRGRRLQRGARRRGTACFSACRGGSGGAIALMKPSHTKHTTLPAQQADTDGDGYVDKRDAITMVRRLWPRVLDPLRSIGVKLPTPSAAKIWGILRDLDHGRGASGCAGGGAAAAPGSKRSERPKSLMREWWRGGSRRDAGSAPPAQSPPPTSPPPLSGLLRAAGSCALASPPTGGEGRSGLRQGEGRRAAPARLCRGWVTAAAAGAPGASCTAAATAVSRCNAMRCRPPAPWCS